MFVLVVPLVAGANGFEKGVLAVVVLNEKVGAEVVAAGVEVNGDEAPLNENTLLLGAAGGAT